MIIDSAIESETNLLVATEIIARDAYVEVIKELFIVVEERDTHGSLLAEETNFPEIKNGYYYFATGIREVQMQVMIRICLAEHLIILH